VTEKNLTMVAPLGPTPRGGLVVRWNLHPAALLKEQAVARTRYVLSLIWNDLSKVNRALFIFLLR
jgi:hypothetical protein